ncbi:MAG: hypothetical protein ABL958_16890, partial [Bdellovibrionia bacterium]
MSLILNALTILRAQRKNKYTFIATDSEYSVFLIRWLLACPLVAINNVFQIFEARAGVSRKDALRLLPTYLVELV